MRPYCFHSARCMNPAPLQEEPRFLQEQIVTYIGNKRHLLDFIGSGVREVQRRLGREKLGCLDAFSGSGVVARFLKSVAGELYVNDLEPYAEVINRCYLANRSAVDAAELERLHADFCRRVERELAPGPVARLYAPQDDERIAPGERVFYTRRNAEYIDTARRLADNLPEEMQPYFLAPLLYEASVHTNTSGVFKGFYKNAAGIGQFGGTGRNALQRILAPISLPLPVFSRFECPCHILRGDAAQVAASLPRLDLAYVDPPYNQHPYGSNYFMLNFILNPDEGKTLSKVSGIPQDWNRSEFNRHHKARQALAGLLESLPARFVLISYNSEGFISRAEMVALLQRFGKVDVMETDYAAFRGSRNLASRSLRVKEYLFLLERWG